MFSQVWPRRQWDLAELASGTWVEVQTESRTYTIVVVERGEAIISGHPRHCPTGVRIDVSAGSDGGRCCIAPGTRLKYKHPQRGWISTSSVRAVAVASPSSNKVTEQ
ncbi:MAG TPA: hypothetical protein VES20_22615 [Bryobacteraceae bacterium]|nr:hypothetical protein [Bryobacteraceae bacterium]